MSEKLPKNLLELQKKLKMKKYLNGDFCFPPSMITPVDRQIEHDQMMVCDPEYRRIVVYETVRDAGVFQGRLDGFFDVHLAEFVEEYCVTGAELLNAQNALKILRQTLR